MSISKKQLVSGLVSIAVLCLSVFFVAYTLIRGSDVLYYTWEWSGITSMFVIPDRDGSGYGAGLLLIGFLNTVRLAFYSIVFSMVLGFVLAFWRTSEIAALRYFAALYVGIVRNIPPVIFIFVFYFFVSSQLVFLTRAETALTEAQGWAWLSGFLFGELGRFSQFSAGVICLVAFQTAYFTEVFRAGLQDIPKTQWEAAQVLRLRRLQTIRKVIIPQVFFRSGPAVSNQIIVAIKDTSIISLISVQDLSFAAMQMTESSGKIFEIWIAVAIFYFVLSYSVSEFMTYLERRSKRAA